MHKESVDSTKIHGMNSWCIISWSIEWLHKPNTPLGTKYHGSSMQLWIPTRFLEWTNLTSEYILWKLDAYKIAMNSISFGKKKDYSTSIFLLPAFLWSYSLQSQKHVIHDKIWPNLVKIKNIIVLFEVWTCRFVSTYLQNLIGLKDFKNILKKLVIKDTYVSKIAILW